MLSALRVTPGMVTRTMVGGLESSLDRLQHIQEQISTGRMVNRPSDSPVAAVASMQLRSSIARTNQLVRNADDGKAWLGTADAALTNSLDLIRRVREVTGSAVAGSIDASARATMASEVSALRDGLIGLANTRYLGRPVFAGTAAGTSAYDATGSYLGDSGTVQRTVAEGTAVAVNVTGPQAFGSGPTGLFAVLSDITAHLQANDTTSLQGDLARLDGATDGLENTLAEVGARYSRVDTMQSAANSRLVTLTGQQSVTEDIDLPKTIMELQLQQTAYQAALGSTAKVIQPSLMDFLK